MIPDPSIYPPSGLDHGLTFRVFLSAFGQTVFVEETADREPVGVISEVSRRNLSDDRGQVYGEEVRVRVQYFKKDGPKAVTTQGAK